MLLTDLLAFSNFYHVIRLIFQVTSLGYAVHLHLELKG